MSKKHYTFTFAQYEHDRIERFHELYKKKLKLRLKWAGVSLASIMLVGSIYPVLMWFEYDINVFKPRMSEYLKKRFK
jgi:hypothetical protein